MALLSEGRNAWIIGELAMFYAGATNVPLSIKLEEANDLLFRLVHADVKYIMVSGQQLGKIRAIKDKLPPYGRSSYSTSWRNTKTVRCRCPRYAGWGRSIWVFIR